MYKENNLSDLRNLNGDRVTIPKSQRKAGRKNGNFLTCLETPNGYVKIKKLEFGWNEAVKQMKKLRRQKLLSS